MQDHPREQRTDKPGALSCLKRDGLITLAVFLVAATVGATYIATWRTYPDGINPWWFAPSVMVAHGEGFVLPDYKSVPALESFLNQETLNIHFGDIPATIRTGEPVYWHNSHRYLLYTVGYLWRVFGISWAALLPLYALMFGATVALSYRIFRLGIGRPLSLLLALAFMVLPSHLDVLPHLRDYSKAPFILGAIYILGRVISTERSWKSVLQHAALLGLVIGIGLGFRLDLKICLFIAVPVLLAGLPAALKKTWKTRLAAAVTMVIVNSVVSYPIQSSIKNEHSTAPHNIFGGFAEDLNDSLGVGGTCYTWLYPFNDSFIYANSTSYAHRVLGVQKPIPYQTHAYTEAGRACLRHVVLTFPGDFALRAYAAVLRNLTFSPAAMGLTFPPLDVDEFRYRATGLLAPLLAHLTRFGVMYAVMAFLIIACHNLRLGLAGLFLLLCFCGYPCLQFQPRHYFHLAFVPLWCFGFVLNRAVALLFSLRKEKVRQDAAASLKSPRSWWSPPVQRALVFTLAMSVAIFAPVWILRLYQAPKVSAMLNAYRHAETRPVKITHNQGSGKLRGWNIASLDDDVFGYGSMSPDEKQWNNHAAYLVVNIEGQSPEVLLRPIYDAADEFNDFSWPVWVPLHPAEPLRHVRYYLPVYESPDAAPWGRRTLAGIALHESSKARITGISAVQDLSQTPYLYQLALSKDGGEKAYQTLQPVLVPDILRSRMAARRNVLVNGGFESWGEDGRPATFGGPERFSTIAKETDYVAQGDCALKQTWAQSDANDALQRMFYHEVMGLEPGTEYELFVKARNTTGASPAIAAWQLKPGNNGGVEFVRLGLELVKVDPASGWREYSGIFKTLPDAKYTVLFNTWLPKDTDETLFPVEVIWDDWRLAKFEKR